MSSDVAIRVEHLSKCYHIYAEPAHRLLQMLARGRRRYFREFWALRDVSFTIARGEAVGIVGRNGSGKSTLLQLICGTLSPTTGEVSTRGRIAALLELGSGFNPEFTGRENVFLNGTILGLTRAEVESRYDEIVAFADIGEFIDQPIKTYSSGMYVRLAFAVQVCLDPDILVVDEALAVGDAYFVHRCFHRIRALKAQGKTILFVSHDTGSVKDLCDRAIWIDSGEVKMIGRPEDVTMHYRAHLFGIPVKAGEGARDAAGEELEAGTDAVETFLDAGASTAGTASRRHETTIPNSDRRLGRHRCRLLGVGLYGKDGAAPVTELRSGQAALLRISFVNESLEAGAPLVVGYAIATPRGEELGAMNTETEGVEIIAPARSQILTVSATVDLPALHAGDYALTIGIASKAGEVSQIEDRIENALVFRVVGDRQVFGWMRFPTQFVLE